jgi:hypothetical protein
MKKRTKLDKFRIVKLLRANVCNFFKKIPMNFENWKSRKFTAQLVYDHHPEDGKHIRLQYLFPDNNVPICSTCLSSDQKNIIGTKALMAHGIERDLRNIFFVQGAEVGIGKLDRRCNIVPKTRRYIR